MKLSSTFIDLLRCIYRPAQSETFDIDGMYEHIGMWNRRFLNDCYQQDMREDAGGQDVDDENRGLRLQLRSWREERVKRVCASPGFVVSAFEEMADMADEDSDATMLLKR